MRKIIVFILGIWCGIVNVITPVWIVMAILNITGKIYEYDYSMDEGTAIIIGMILAVLWILLALVPNIYLGKRLKLINIKLFYTYLASMILLYIAGVAICDWDIVGFLTT